MFVSGVCDQIVDRNMVGYAMRGKLIVLSA
jgi:hypothetical protein